MDLQYLIEKYEKAKVVRRVIAFSLDPEIIDYLTNTAKICNISRSEFVNMIINEFRSRDEDNES